METTNFALSERSNSQNKFIDFEIDFDDEMSLKEQNKFVETDFDDEMKIEMVPLKRHYQLNSQLKEFDDDDDEISSEEIRRSFTSLLFFESLSLFNVICITLVATWELYQTILLVTLNKSRSFSFFLEPTPLSSIMWLILNSAYFIFCLDWIPPKVKIHGKSWSDRFVLWFIFPILSFIVSFARYFVSVFHDTIPFYAFYAFLMFWAIFLNIAFYCIAFIHLKRAMIKYYKTQYQEALFQKKYICHYEIGRVESPPNQSEESRSSSKSSSRESSNSSEKSLSDSFRETNSPKDNDLKVSLTPNRYSFFSYVIDNYLAFSIEAHRL